ncbi:histidine ammonia-lyase [Pseudothermotoga thermarum]|uniref:histidine ammonia-lyase n=1 Tax=Pseudothermotoga thermarum TaxID=119394 RepID=UPI001FE0EE39|nr:histidine ammonia-lyase [Pseudothermotoga thermarum]
MSLVYVGHRLKIQEVIKVARNFEKVEIPEDVLKRMEKSRKKVESVLSQEKVVYGVNTGFGALATVKISKEELLKLQENIILSHACGIGDPLSEDIVRAAMLLRAHSLALGFSGVRPIVVEKLCELLNKRITPFVPSKGSVGASGDLAPLSHIALVLLNKGYVYVDGKAIPTQEVTAKLGFEPLQLAEKEGLSLVNGTQAMTAILALCINDCLNMVELATRIAALSSDILFASPDAYSKVVGIARPHRGQKIVAKMLEKLFQGSKIRESHKNCLRVQDAYSLRCIPQVYGVVLDTIFYALNIAEIEMNSATDNPLVYEDEIISQGNFHGEPIALVADFLTIALTSFGNMIERRIDRLVNPKTNEGLPAFLTPHSGTNSGYMIWQYTAAALCNENKILSHPASCDTIPTSAYQEDHVSMGMNACLKLLKVIDNVTSLLAIEAMCAIRALRFRRPLTTSPENEKLVSQIEPLLIDKLEDEFMYDQFVSVKDFLQKKIKNVYNEWWLDYEGDDNL